MYLEERIDSKGKLYFRFSYVDHTGKRVRFPANKTPVFESREEAERWAKSQAASIESKRAFIAQREEWKKRYYDHSELLSLFERYQQEQAPNSWESSVGHIRQWVFYYFLTLHDRPNLNDWHIWHQDFRNWLKSDARNVVKRKQQPLATSTVNNIIASFNCFMECLIAHKRIDPTTIKKLKSFRPDFKARRGIEDIIPEDELRGLIAILKERSERFNNQTLNQKGGRTRHMDPKVTAEFLYVLWNTGLRFNELFGLPMKAIHKGDIKHQLVSRELKTNGIIPIGYIYLDSQTEEAKFHTRGQFGEIPRKPLKSMKEISAKNSRTIPIESPEVWNILAARYQRQNILLKERRHGADQNNYLLFEDLNWNEARADLAQAFKDMKLPNKGFHACRHSFATLLVGRTGSQTLTRLITGHRTYKSFERYLHIFEEVSRAAEQSSNEIDLVPHSKASGLF
jgi:integrase